MQSLADTEERSSKRIIIILCLIGLIGLISFALAAATLATVNQRFNDLDKKLNAFNNILITAATATPPVKSIATTMSSSIATGTEAMTSSKRETSSSAKTPLAR